MDLQDKISLRQKRKIAAVEQSGKTTGDYAQLEEAPIKELQRLKMLPNDVSSAALLNQALANPEMYDRIINSYISTMKPTTEKDKALWLLMPSRYSSTKGNINAIPNPRLRNKMQNRVKNYQDIYERNFWWMDKPNMENAPIPTGADLEEFLRRRKIR